MAQAAWRWLMVWGVMMALVACGGGEQAPLSFSQSGAIEGSQVPDWELVDQGGEPFRLAEQRGKVVLLFFGYTQCPDVCPMTLATWRQAAEQLGAQADQVRWLFVTVDPARDTPARLAQHVSGFDPRFVGLTGEEAALQQVYQLFNIYHEKEEAGSAAGYLVSHSSSVIVIDPAGRLVARLPFGASAEEVAATVRAHLP